jgi:hypothetical protein
MELNEKRNKTHSVAFSPQVTHRNYSSEMEKE